MATAGWPSMMPMMSLSFMIRSSSPSSFTSVPDHPALLQTYVWQDLDLAPEFPTLRQFLKFWTRELEGRLHSVRVASGGPIRPARLHHTSHMLTLH